MVKEIGENMVRIVVLDISGVYVQIHDQGYFGKDTIKDIQNQYSDAEHWRVFVLD